MEISREQLQKDLERKVAHRKFALESYDQLSFIDLDNPLSEKESYRRLKSNLVDAKELAFQDGYFAIISKRKGIGKLEVFWKKAVRKLIKIFYGWYIFPIYKRQTNYNELMVTNLHLIREMMEEQQEEIELLKEKLRLLEEEKSRGYTNIENVCSETAKKEERK